jgi:hypothetical protein
MEASNNKVREAIDWVTINHLESVNTLLNEQIKRLQAQVARQENRMSVVSHILNEKRINRIVERLNAVKETVGDAEEGETALEISLIAGAVANLRRMWVDVITADTLDVLVKDMQGLMDEHLRLQAEEDSDVIGDDPHAEAWAARAEEGKKRQEEYRKRHEERIDRVREEEAKKRQEDK